MSSTSSQGKGPPTDSPQIKLDPIKWALQENHEDWYRDLVEHSRDLLCIHDLQGRLLSVNPAPARTLGYSVEEMLQIPMREMIAPEFRDQFDSYLKQVERHGEAHGKMVVVTRSGERRVWEFRNSLKTQGEAAPIVRGIAHDVTEQRRAQKELQSSEERYRSVIAAMAEGVVVQDDVGKIVACNESAERILGVPAKELMGLSSSDRQPYTVREDGSAFLGEDHPSMVTLRTGQPQANVCMGILRPSGDTRWISINSHPLFRTNQKRPYAAVTTFTDITERKSAEQALRESEERERAHAKELETVLDVLPIPVMIAHDAECRHVTANRMGREHLRLEPGANASMSVPAGEKPRLRFLRDGAEIPVQELPMQRAAATGRPEYGIPMTVAFEDGTELHELTNAVPLLGEDGKVRGAVAAAIDITERKRAEDDLRASEERLRLAQEAAKIGTFERNFQSGESRWSPEMEAMYGLPPGEFPKSIEAFLDLIHAKDRPYVARLIEQSTQTGEAEGEWRVIWPDGTVHWIDGRWRVLKDEQGHPLRALGVDFDITARKRAEEALRAGQEMIAQAQKAAQLGCFEWDMKDNRLFWSPEQERLYGLVPGTFSGKRIEDWEAMVFPEDMEATKTTLQAGFQSGQASSEFRIRHQATGEVRWVLAAGRVICDDHGAPVRMIGVNMDVTERKRAEEALRTSEERLRVALKNSPIQVYNQDRDLRYTWVYNPPEGWTENDYLGKTDDEIFGPEIGARMKALKQPVLDRGESAREESTFAIRGRTYHCDVTVEPLRDALGRVVGINCASVDVTPMRNVMDELRIAKEKLAEEKLYLEQEIDTVLGFEEIIGQSPALKEVMEQVGKVAASDATVLLLGETGTGKELVARALHRLSRRAGSSFIKMNCAAIPSGLLESELFGYEKGAFTGAISKKLGRLELADKGTLFLDEIGEISLALQPKLLRVLQDQEFERLGGTQTLKVDFRLIAATNRDLGESVKKNEFRSDLYYRLNVFPVRVPPLRERREDIRLLVEHFVQKCAKRMNRKITSIPKKTMDALMQWDWPGNVRELENFVERSVILTHGSVLVAPLSELTPVSEVDGNDTLEAAEREHILRALRESRGQIGGPKGAAARLGLKRTTLQSKLKQMGIDRRPPAGQ